MTVSEAAKVLGVSPDRVRVYADAGQLRVTRTVHGERVLDPEDVERFKRVRRSWTKPHACLYCGATVAAHQVFCKSDECKKRRQRIRFHRSQALKKATAAAAAPPLTEADWKEEP
jgi:excisionase family DNA binding protein